MSQIKDSIKKLVDRFKEDEARLTVKSSTYQETEVRVEFIDPLFKLLGWQMDNASGLSSSLRDVLREESQQTESSTKKPDYTFRIATKRKFFLEAKRPSVDIRISKESAFQVRSYGYTAGHDIAVLTNFRTLRIYDARLQPKAGDAADVGLLVSIDYEDYVSKADYILKTLGRDQVASGSIEETFKSTSSGDIPANASFLNRINSWRVRISQDLVSRHPQLTINELSDLTQKIINRIIFIRMCEDRGIEGEYVLRDVAQKKSMLELRALFKRLDDRYNTGLFDVSKDRLQDNYELDCNVFIDIVDEVYAPNSPYSFGVLDADFLGQVYELFLGQQLILKSDGSIALEIKPAYVHREIVTTPQPIVDEVVDRVFKSKFYDMKSSGLLTLDSINSLHVFDIAVGSSRFLLKAFDELIEAAIECLISQGDYKHLYRVAENNYKLDFAVKKDVLRNCLFGCDIDFNAVEIARFSLMVRLLEDETKDTLPPVNHKKILPDLDNNIFYGNTVVDSEEFSTTSEDVLNKTVPFNWVLSGLPNNFDVIIGNPPYIKTEEMISDNQEEMDYFKRHYRTAYKQFDKYFVFIETALSKAKSDAWIGMVVPNKWITIGSGKKLREILSKGGFVSQLVDFGNEKIFDGKSAYVCLLILSKDGVTDFHYRYVNDYQRFLLSPQELGFSLPTDLIRNVGGNAWVLPNDQEEAFVLGRLTKNSTPLSELIDVKNGIQTSANDVFLIEDYSINGDYIDFVKDDISWSIERSITRPYVSKSSGVISYLPINADALMIFPYEMSERGTPAPIDPEVMRSDYPQAMIYLEHYKGRLNKRKVSPPPKPGVFYAYGRHQALDAVFSYPKIIYSVNQKGGKYALDSIGVAYASGGTAGEVALFNPVKGYSLEFLLGLLNHRAIEFYVRKRGSPFGGGWYARGSAVISEVPVPNLNILGSQKDKAIHDDISTNVKALMTNRQSMKTSSGRAYDKLLLKDRSLLNSLEVKFNSIWGFTDEIRDLRLPGENEN
ncbi:Eco57I restriction-modification methylase domain-containing protein [Methylophaga sp.]|uniref:Eco57I restriction-modification methylase domain-containing protein n=1 Tax=Methylophaga sp. TaxID=2024840 RepID=UPI00176B6058|nr:Eco57I restriction-modification methylase domain-containing protein [Methylophaga sp.]HIC45650.1 hypothetical protein [Methylophaga sp.]